MNTFSHCLSASLRGLNRAIFALLFYGAYVAMLMPVCGTQRNWTGAASANWSNPNNWNPSGTPQNGDQLLFGWVSDSNRSMVNDIQNLSVSDIEFVDNNYQINGNALTVDQLISGDSASLNSTTTTLNCPIIFPNKGQNVTLVTTSLQDGFSEVTSDIRLNGPITIAGKVFVRPKSDGGVGGANGHVYFSGPVSGSGDILAIASKSGNHVSSIIFNGSVANAFSGRLYLESDGNAPIIFNNSSGVVVSNIVAVDPAYTSAAFYQGHSPGSITANLQLNGSSQIDPNATILLNAGGQLTLTGTSPTVGNLVLTNYGNDADASILDTGSITLGLNGAVIASNGSSTVTPLIKGTLNLNGYLHFDIDGGPVEIDANIEGNGFYKTGDGLLRLSGNNSYFGDTEVTAGTIEARSGTAFGKSSQPSFGVHLEGGNIVLQSASIGFSPLFVSTLSQGNGFLTSFGKCSWSQPIHLDANLNIVPVDPTSSGQSLTIVGAISGTGGLNFLSAIFGTGSVVLEGGDNSFTGPTTVQCQLLQLSKSQGFHALTGPLIVGGGSGSAICEVRWTNPHQLNAIPLTVYANGLVNLNNNNEDFGAVTFNGGQVNTGTGQFAIYQPLTVNASSSSAVINGMLGLPPGDARVFNVAKGTSGCDLLVNAVIFGNAPFLAKQGPGTMCLFGTNSFAGTTLLEEGILHINNGSALSTTPCVIFTNATLYLESTGVLPTNFEIVGSGVGGTEGAIEVAPAGSYSLQGSILLDATTTFSIHDSGFLYVNGLVSGNGPLIKSGPGTMTFGSGINNTYSGDTIVRDGTLYSPRTAGIIAIPGNLVIGPAPSGSQALAELKAPGNLGGSTVTVNANGVLGFSGFTQTLGQLNLNDGGSVQTGSGTLAFSSGGQIAVGSLNSSGSHVGSMVQGTLGIAPNDVLTFNVSPFAPSAPFDSNAELNVLALISKPAERSDLAPAGIVKSGGGRMRVHGNSTYQGKTQVNGGTLQVDANQPSSRIEVDSGTLTGGGIVGDVVLANGTSALLPGDHPGTLTCANFNPAGFGGGSGTLQIELNGRNPGEYDQLIANGIVSLSGITLSPSLNYAASLGDQFVIVKNNGGSAVSGTFSGLAQGATLNLGGHSFQINYAGGSGHDVVLSTLTNQPPPLLTIQSLPPDAVELLWQTNDPAFVLQFNTDLGGANWQPAAPAPVVLGTNFVVTNSTTTAQVFYRLFKH